MSDPDKKTSRFVVLPPAMPKAPIDPAAVERFAAGAADPAPNDSKPVAPVQATSTVVGSTADRTKGFLLRLLPEQFDRVEQVYKHSTFKSKQTMGEKLFMEGVEALAKKLGI